MKGYNRVIVSIVLVLSLLFGSVTAYATGIDDQKDVIENLEDKKDEAVEEKKEITASIDKLANEMEQLQEDINAKFLEIEQAEDDLVDAQITVAEQYNAMKLRIAYMYENDDVSYLELLIDAEDMSDFLNRVEYLNNVVEYDREQLDKYEAAVVVVEEHKATVEAESEVLLALQIDQESKNKELDGLLKKLNVTIADLSDEISVEKDELEKLVKAAEEEEKKREEAAAAGGQQGGSNVSGNGYFSHPIPGYSRISSPFGYRTHPISGAYTLHNGVDFAAASGTPIYAAADGVVISASYSGGAGNLIIIDHGGGLATVYMHNLKMFVSAGQKVSRGQNISLCGSTGNSTGPHLHFGVKKNGAYVNPMSYL